MSEQPKRSILARAGEYGSLVVRRRTEPAWPEQYERMQRMSSRLKHGDRDQQEQLDDLMVFFQSAWHLKDWIRNDETLSARIRERIEDELGKRETLLICRDLAVGGKHFAVWSVRGRPKALLGLATHQRRRTTMQLGGESPGHKVTEEESSEGVVVLLPPEIEGLPEGEHDAELETLSALSVAHEIVAAWDELLADIGLRA